MKARTPFWPLVRNGLGLNLFGPWPALLWLLCNLVIVFFYVSPQFPQGFAHERTTTNRVGDGVIGCSILIYAWVVAGVFRNTDAYGQFRRDPKYR
jgi:hypothetical protein